MLRTKQHGFTLMELMIVVAVLAILAAIAIPSFSHFTKKAQLRKAQSALLENAHALEQAYAQKKKFYDTSTNKGVLDPLPTVNVGDSTNPKFKITISYQGDTDCGGLGATSDKYCMVATPNGNWARRESRKLILDHTGKLLVCQDSACSKTKTDI